MTLIQKCKKLYYKYALPTALALATTTFSQPGFADFYDGARGPSKAQVHCTTTSSGDNSIAAKYFGDHIFAVGSLANNKSLFVGVGYIAEFDYVNAIPVIGYSTDGKNHTLHGVAQATISIDKDGTFLADSRYIVHLSAEGFSHEGGLTASVGNNQIRAGVDTSYNGELNNALLLRYDIDAKKHSSWIQVGIDQQGVTQFQFRGNF